MSAQSNHGASLTATVAQTERRNKFNVDQWEDKMQEISIPKDIQSKQSRLDIKYFEIINKLVMNYLIVEGYKQGALKFEKETGIKAEMDMELIDSRIEIRRLIEKGQIEEAINTVNRINPEILDQNIELQFELKRQHLVELIKAKNISDALMYAQTHLSQSFIKLQRDFFNNYSSQTNQQPQIDQKLANYFKLELEKTMTLLMYEDLAAQALPDKLQELVDTIINSNTNSRKKLASKVNMAVLQYEGIPNDLKLGFYWQMLQYSQQQLVQGDNAMEFPKLKDPMGELEL